MSINQDLKEAGLTQRMGLIVYLVNPREQYKLRYYGDIVYFSNKMNYCVIYLNSDDEDLIDEIKELSFVKKVEKAATESLNLDSQYIENQIAKMAEETETELEKRQTEGVELLN